MWKFQVFWFWSKNVEKIPIQVWNLVKNLQGISTQKNISMGITCKMNGGKNLKGIYSQKIFSMGITCKLNWENLHVISSQKKNYMGITCKMDLDQI